MQTCVQVHWHVGVLACMHVSSMCANPLAGWVCGHIFPRAPASYVSTGRFANTASTLLARCWHARLRWDKGVIDGMPGGLQAGVLGSPPSVRELHVLVPSSCSVRCTRGVQ
jgi:hypothetical protein